VSELVVAAHAVESALTRIYGKLGVRSRTERARHLAEAKEGWEALPHCRTRQRSSLDEQALPTIARSAMRYRVKLP
jgi:hypothetical protein